MEDGTTIVDLPRLHLNPILHINVSQNSRWLVTCGRDKKIVVTDWMSNTRLASLKDHSDMVTYSIFCKNDNYLFTASEDKTVNIYHTYNWKNILKLNAGFSIDFLEFSIDNSFLLAFSKYPNKEGSGCCFW